MTSMAHFSLPRMCSVIILCLRSGQSSINRDECWTLQLYISNFLSKVSLPSVNAGFPPSCIPDQTFYQIDSNHSLSPFTNFSQFKLDQGDVTSEIPLFVEKGCLFRGASWGWDRSQMSVALPKISQNPNDKEVKNNFAQEAMFIPRRLPAPIIRRLPQIISPPPNLSFSCLSTPQQQSDKNT